MNAKLVACGIATCVAVGVAISANADMNSAKSGDCAPVRTVAGRTVSDRGFSFSEKYIACAGGFGSGSEEYIITLDTSKQTGLKVFSIYSNVPPTVRWDKQSNLVIYISEVGDIRSSYLVVDGIKIHYQAPSELSPAGFESHLLSYRDRVARNIKEGVSTFSTGSEAEDIKILNNVIERERKSYSVFAQWAQNHKVQYVKKGVD